MKPRKDHLTYTSTRWLIASTKEDAALERGHCHHRGWACRRFGGRLPAPIRLQGAAGAGWRGTRPALPASATVESLAEGRGQRRGPGPAPGQILRRAEGGDAPGGEGRGDRPRGAAGAAL